MPTSQLSLHALEPVLHNHRSHRSEKPTHHSQRKHAGRNKDLAQPERKREAADKLTREPTHTHKPARNHRCNRQVTGKGKSPGSVVSAGRCTEPQGRGHGEPNSHWASQGRPGSRSPTCVARKWHTRPLSWETRRS